MFNPVVDFRPFSVIKAIERSHKIAGDAANPFKSNPFSNLSVDD
jgi:hypothetical protein